MKTIREIAISHQKQMGSVHPHAIIGAIEDAIEEYVKQSQPKAEANDKSYEDLLCEATGKSIQYLRGNFITVDQALSAMIKLQSMLTLPNKAEAKGEVDSFFNWSDLHLEGDLTKSDCIQIINRFKSTQPLPSDTLKAKLKDAFIDGYNLCAKSTIAQADVINFNFDSFFEDWYSRRDGQIKSITK